MDDWAIFLLNERAEITAQNIKSVLPQATIWGLRNRVKNADYFFDDFTQALREAYRARRPIIGLCASGILIRILAPVLEDKMKEAPLLALSDDSAAIVPLLGGLTGANEMAVQLAQELGGFAAVTASGSRHFGLQLGLPPATHVLANVEAIKKVTSDLLAGAKIRLSHPFEWIEKSDLPLSEDGEIEIVQSIYKDVPENGLLYHPKSLVLNIRQLDSSIRKEEVLATLAQLNIAPQSIACVVCDTADQDKIAYSADLAKNLNLSLRLSRYLEGVKITRTIGLGSQELLALAQPPTVEDIGVAYGTLSVIGLGPGQRTWMTEEVREELARAEILIGYETYLNMVPDRVGQQKIATPNRVELDRAHHAIRLASQGRYVCVVSSGDPGIFAMASAVCEAIEDKAGEAALFDLKICPGISAMQGAASRVGAPLGHDFAVISLSDIRKPWSIIKKRLKAAAQADLVIALYNPASKTRKKQVKKMRKLLLKHKAPETPVIMAKNISRDGETVQITTLKALPWQKVDMRTLLIIGSSKTREVQGLSGQKKLFTPRDYDL